MAKLDDYLVKISGATPVDLLVISYDIMLEELAAARDAHGDDPARFIEGIMTTRSILVELVGALDFTTSDIPGDLYSLYEYIGILLLSALTYEKTEKLAEAIEILTPLRDAWVTARENAPESAAIFQNAPKVYSGLTFNKKGLTEFIDDDPNRGFKA